MSLQILLCYSLSHSNTYDIISGGDRVSVAVPEYQWRCQSISGGARVSVAVPEYRWRCQSIVAGWALGGGAGSCTVPLARFLQPDKLCWHFFESAS